MRRQTMLIFAVAAFALGAPALVCAPLRATAATDPCYDKAMSQTALHLCADAAARASQRRVDAAYAALQKNVDAAERSGVRADQRAWLAYRNANCASVSNVDLPAAGSMAPEINLECFTQRNNARIAYLRWRAAPPEERQRRAMP